MGNSTGGATIEELRPSRTPDDSGTGAFFAFLFETLCNCRADIQAGRCEETRLTINWLLTNHYERVPYRYKLIRLVQIRNEQDGSILSIFRIPGRFMLFRI